MPDSELLQLTISEIAPKVRAREVSPRELTQAALAEAERRQPTLNSFIAILRESALAQAEEADAVGDAIGGRLPRDGGAAALHIGEADAQRPNQRENGQSEQDKNSRAEEGPLHEPVFAIGAAHRLSFPPRGGGGDLGGKCGPAAVGRPAKLSYI